MLNLMGYLAPCDTRVIDGLILILRGLNVCLNRQLTAVATLSLFGHIHLHTLLCKLSEVHCQIDLLSCDDSFIATGEELDDLDGAGLGIWYTILDVEGAWELERLIHGDLFNVSLAH